MNTDLSYFNLIIPCGITTKPVTSMQQELGRELDLTAVAESISRNFGTVFQSQMLWVETLDALLGPHVGVPMKPPSRIPPAPQGGRRDVGMTGGWPALGYSPNSEATLNRLLVHLKIR